ncbi:SLAP domain-containing protein [Halalkalibacter alkalisediminis]|uniref:SLAP domain-containing protein n=1 Tax=Halalkalibacter alkalisediminis TaxID=935616 RepID=A0ABV6NKM7_9BACI|nr:SLAP domain-containing protein [Halalkalibacter alkalisediminis]
MKKYVNLFIVIVGLLAVTGCSNGQETASDTTNLKLQQKIENSTNKEPVEAYLVVLEDQEPLKRPEAKKLLNSSMEEHPTIEAGVIDVIPLAAQYGDGGVLHTMFFVRNGTEFEVDAVDLADMTYTITSTTGETIATADFYLQPEGLGTLKPGEVRAMRYDFEPKFVKKNDYDFTIGYNATIKF